MIQVGEDAPGFCLHDGDEKEICLKSYHGKWVVLYFYPKDNTSGCTREAMDFTAVLDALHIVGGEVLGISRDSPESHRKFAEKHNLKIKLLSDPDHKVMDAYGVWALKKMYGRETYGIVRSTFLIDPVGRIAQIWRFVEVKGHVDTVGKSLKDLQNASD